MATLTTLLQNRQHIPIEGGRSDDLRILIGGARNVPEIRILGSGLLQRYRTPAPRGAVFVSPGRKSGVGASHGTSPEGTPQLLTCALNGSHRKPRRQNRREKHRDDFPCDSSHTLHRSSQSNIAPPIPRPAAKMLH